MAQRTLQQIERIPAWSLAAFVVVLFLSATVLAFATGGIFRNVAVFEAPPLHQAFIQGSIAAGFAAQVFLFGLVAVLFARYRTAGMALLLLVTSIPLAFLLGNQLGLVTGHPVFQGIIALSIMVALVGLIAREMTSGAYTEPSLVTEAARQHATRADEVWQRVVGNGDLLWLGGAVLVIGAAWAVGVLPGPMTLWNLPDALVIAAVLAAWWLWRTTGLTLFAAYLLLPHAASWLTSAAGYGWPEPGTAVTEITAIMSEVIVIGALLGALEQVVSWTLLLVAVGYLVRESRSGYYGPAPEDQAAASVIQA